MMRPGEQITCMSQVALGEPDSDSYSHLLASQQGSVTRVYCHGYHEVQSKFPQISTLSLVFVFLSINPPAKVISSSPWQRQCAVCAVGICSLCSPQCREVSLWLCLSKLLLGVHKAEMIECVEGMCGCSLFIYLF